MDYYSSPEGSERALRSRIRRCYTALEELLPEVETLYDSADHLNEDYAVDAVREMYEMSREAARGLTDVANLDIFDGDIGVQRVQERLLTSPGIADDICDAIEKVHDGAKVVLRNIEYQLDAGHFAPTDDIYQTIRETAVTVLGLTTLIMDAIDAGFITDVAVYKEKDL